MLLKQKQHINSTVSSPPQNPQSNFKGLSNHYPAEYADVASVGKGALKLDSSKAVPSEMDLAQNSPNILTFSASKSVEMAPKADTTPSLLAAEDHVPCEKCGSLILVWEMPEHMDYHFAVELQKSFLQPHSSNPQVVSALTQGKRNPKSPLSSGNKRPRPEGMQTLESFFKPLPH